MQKNLLKISLTILHLDFKAAINLSPDYIGYHNNIGDTYESLGEIELALDAFQKVIEIYPDDEYALSSIASLLKDPFESLSILKFTK